MIPAIIAQRTWKEIVTVNNRSSLCFFTRTYSNKTNKKRHSQLVRTFISKKLGDYYAQPADQVVGTSPIHPTRLSSLFGSWHWQRSLQTAYDRKDGQWLTPVELFQPHYSNILADYAATWLRSQNKDALSFDIVEVGGGRGTNALCILSRLQKAHPDIYDRVTYTLVDASPTLHQYQKQVLSTSAAMDSHKKVVFQQNDLIHVAEQRWVICNDY